MVAIAGTRVAVGAPYEQTNAGEFGRVYGFDLTASSPSVATIILDDPGLSLDDSFGHAVAIAGTLMVVGAPYEGTGAEFAGNAYVYDLGSATPTVPAFILNNPKPGFYDLFGSAVAISGRRVVIGAFMDRSGAPSSGSAYVYDLDSATPTVPLAKLNNPNPSANGFFGFSVSISGSHVAVGATKDDTGARNAGRVYIYNLDGARPAAPVLRLNNPNPVRDDYFGWSVAISDMRVAVGTPHNDAGASNSGCVYIYDLSSRTPKVPVETLTNPYPAENDFFGSAAAISGTRVVVGAANDDKRAANAGSAYLFDLVTTKPGVPTVVFQNPAPAINDNFGYSVGIAGTRVVIGTYRDDTGAPDAGIAYAYDVSGSTPGAPIATLSKATPAPYDRFGRSVAIDGKTIVVGTPFDDTTREDKGAVYVFEP